LIYFEGGSWCGDITYDYTLNHCAERSKTDLGSSNDYADKMEFDGILSR